MKHTLDLTLVRRQCRRTRTHAHALARDGVGVSRVGVCPFNRVSPFSCPSRLLTYAHTHTLLPKQCPSSLFRACVCVRAGERECHV